MDLLVCQHKRDGAIECHLVVELVLKHIEIVQSIRLPVTVGEHMWAYVHVKPTSQNMYSLPPTHMFSQ